MHFTNKRNVVSYLKKWSKFCGGERMLLIVINNHVMTNVLFTVRKQILGMVKSQIERLIEI